MLQKLHLESAIVISDFLPRYNKISTSKWNRLLLPAANLCW